MCPSPKPSVSRRSLLLGGAAAASVPLVGSVGSPAAAAVLPLVKPLRAQDAYSAFGVCAHPNFSTSVYKYIPQWMAALSNMGVAYFRGVYAPGINATAVTTKAARDYRLGWSMEIAESVFTPESEIVARVRHIARNAADVCRFIEGLNEPNYVRTGGAPPSDWVARTVRRQRAIWQTVKSEPALAHVKVIGPSLQAVHADAGDYRALAAAGLNQYMDLAAMHRYPAGHYPDRLIDQQLGWIRTYWGGKKTRITESGYNNALARTTGALPVPEDVSAAYAPSVLLEAVDRGCSVSWYEALDDVDAGAKNIVESNFGLFALKDGMAPPWRAKPAVAELKSFLASLKDPGADFTTRSVGLRISSNAGDLRKTVVQKRSGSTAVFLRRATDCWDPNDQRRISVARVPVTVQTASGTRTFYVDHRVQRVVL